MSMLDEKLNVKSGKQTDAERELAERRMLAANYARLMAKRAEDTVASTTVLEPQVEQEQPVEDEVSAPEMSSPVIAPADTQEQLEMKRRYCEFVYGKPFASQLVADEPVDSAVAEPLPATEEETDDSRPSPETMRHIAARAVTAPAVAYAPAATVAPATVGASVATAPVVTVAQSTEEKQGFLSMLSMKTKMVLLAVVSAIVLAIVLICINSSLISAANSSIATKQQRLEELQSQYQTIQEQIAEITDPENVAEWAIEHGMVQG